MAYGPKQTLREGYEKFVIKNPEGCWDWKGCAPKNPGYGQFRSEMKRWRAHIASWILHYGPIPEGMCVCHHCDNVRCSRPDHLFLGTKKDNNLDAIKKNINPYIGKKRDENHMTKIYTDDVKLILELSHQGYTQNYIAKLFNVSQSIISRVTLQAQGVGY